MFFLNVCVFSFVDSHLLVDSVRSMWFVVGGSDCYVCVGGRVGGEAKVVGAFVKGKK